MIKVYQNKYHYIINWNDDGYFLGRNGMFKCKGLSIYTFINGNIEISPITSKGKEGRYWIEVPGKEIPNILQFLSKIYHENFMQKEV